MSFLIAAIVEANVDLDEGVMVLTESNFDQELANHEFLLVEFYAPWCGHCKKLKPEFEAAAKILASHEPPRSLAKVDVTENKELESRFNIKSYPTLIWFVNQKHKEYTGGRTTNTIVSWISKRTGPPSTELLCDDILDTVNQNKLSLVFFGDFQGDLYKLFQQIAMDNEYYNFYHASGECA